jgi:hypothetical protein
LPDHTGFKWGGDHTQTTTFEMFFTIVLLPIYLVAGNYILSKKFRAEKFFAVNALVILSCIPISAHLHFLNWADSVGNRINPDYGTKEVMAFEHTAGLIIAAIGIALATHRLYKRRQLIEYNRT